MAAEDAVWTLSSVKAALEQRFRTPTDARHKLYAFEIAREFPDFIAAGNIAPYMQGIARCLNAKPKARQMFQDILDHKVGLDPSFLEVKVPKNAQDAHVFLAKQLEAVSAELRAELNLAPGKTLTATLLRKDGAMTKLAELHMTKPKHETTLAVREHFANLVRLEKEWVALHFACMAEQLAKDLKHCSPHLASLDAGDGNQDAAVRQLARSALARAEEGADVIAHGRVLHSVHGIINGEASDEELFRVPPSAQVGGRGYLDKDGNAPTQRDQPAQGGPSELEVETDSDASDGEQSDQAYEEGQEFSGVSALAPPPGLGLGKPGMFDAAPSGGRKAGEAARELARTGNAAGKLDTKGAGSSFFANGDDSGPSLFGSGRGGSLLSGGLGARSAAASALRVPIQGGVAETKQGVPGDDLFPSGGYGSLSTRGFERQTASGEPPRTRGSGSSFFSSGDDSGPSLFGSGRGSLLSGGLSGLKGSPAQREAEGEEEEVGSSGSGAESNGETARDSGEVSSSAILGRGGRVLSRPSAGAGGRYTARVAAQAPSKREVQQVKLGVTAGRSAADFFARVDDDGPSLFRSRRDAAPAFGGFK